MATSSTFTTAHRRKKLATYGKTSRATSAFSWTEDAPSPERPRKQAGAAGGRLQKPSITLGEGARSAGNVSKDAGRDVFDVPSEDDAPQPPTPVRAKTLPKLTAPVDDFDVPSSDEGFYSKQRVERPTKTIRRPHADQRNISPPPHTHPRDNFDVPKKHTGKASQPPPISKTVVAPEKITNAVRIPQSSSKAPPKQRAKTPQPSLPARNNATEDGFIGKHKAVNQQPRLQQAAPQAQLIPTKQKPKVTVTHPSRQASAKPITDLDVFEVPSSDEDTPLRTPRKARATPIPRGKTPATAEDTTTRPVIESQTESDDSITLKKRKRQPSQLAEANDNAATSVAHRGPKQHKKEGRIFPGHGSGVPQLAMKQSQAPPNGASTNKSKRTRVRTTSGLPPAPITKGQSSPAKLHGMLAVRSLSKTVPKPATTELFEPVLLEDETMYDIADPVTPHASSANVSAPGSVTPRQTQMLSNLLGDSSDPTTPGMPSISRLHLTTPKAGSALLALTRSSSDIPQSASSRKARLVDTLRQAAPVAVHDEEDDSESDEEAEGDVAVIPEPSARASISRNSVRGNVDEMDMDVEIQAESQQSQGAVHSNNNSKVTYAKQRSYLEEANPEDDLFLAINFEEPQGLGGLGSKHTFDEISDDEDDPASQVRGIHELRSQGQNQKFQMEVQNAIDDISGKAGLGSSVRRSAMLELCTKMTNNDFIDQFLDSALLQQFVKNLGLKGEMIFDFAALVAVALIAYSEPGSTVLDQVYRSGVMETASKLLDIDTDIDRVAKERKTNLSRLGRENVSQFRVLIQEASFWASGSPQKMSPQVMALKSLEILVLGLRKTGNTDALLDETVIKKLITIASRPCESLRAQSATSTDLMLLDLALSILEAASMSSDSGATWSNKILQSLAEMLPVFFDAGDASPIKLSIRLCMNLTNNKPKACEPFAVEPFIQPLMKSISHSFSSLANELDAEVRTDVFEGLILSLGAMINLAEYSDHARLSVLGGNGRQLIDGLVKTFLEGTARAAQADSLEESQINVTIGYLSVLLGNLCMNKTVRQEIQSRLPEQRIDTLVEQIKEFVVYNERVDRGKGQFEGEEGQETWRSFTTRLMLVADTLLGTEA